MSKKAVSLPDLGEGVTEGELVKWLVKVGDTVLEEQTIAEFMTDKATVEIPSPYAGLVVQLNYKEGDNVEINKEILILEKTKARQEENKKPEDKKEVSEKSEAKKASQSQNQEQTQAPSSLSSSQELSSSQSVLLSPPVACDHVLASPSTRRLARQLGVDLNQVTPTGHVGRVLREDVEKAGSLEKPHLSLFQRPAVLDKTEKEQRVLLRGLRKKIAEAMQKSKQIVPHFTLVDEACVTDVIALRQQAKSLAESLGIKVTFLPFVIKALILTLRKFPELNASLDDEKKEIVYKKYFHIGFAADTPEGLVVPVIRFADQKNILQLSQEITDLALRARAQKLKT